MGEKVSVILPVFNVENYIHSCMKSVLGQTLNNIEIILVDDGSTDGSGEIAEQYAEKYEHVKVKHKQNGGLSSARNEGLKYAAGEYISFIDPDDWIEENMLEEMYKLGVEKNADIVMCEIIREFGGTDGFHHMKIPFKKDIYEESSIKEVLLPCIISPRDAGDDMLGSSCRNLYSNKMLKENNLCFDENIRYCEDIVFNTRAFAKARYVGIKRRGLYHYRANPNSLLHSYYNDSKYADIMMYSYNKLLDIVQEEELPKAINESIYRRVQEGLNAIIINFFVTTRGDRPLARLNKFNELLRSKILFEACRLKVSKQGIKQKFLCFCSKYRLKIILLMYGHLWFKLRFKGNITKT